MSVFPLMGVATGPTQSGKTLACFIISLLYRLFELAKR
jgi:hypothetical protein